MRKIKSPIDFAFAVLFGCLTIIAIFGAFTGRPYCLIEAAFIAPLSLGLLKESIRKENDVHNL